MGSEGGDAAAAAAVAEAESSAAEEGRSSSADAEDDGSEAERKGSDGDLGAETRTPLLQQPRDAPAHAEAAEVEQMAADMPDQMQVRQWIIVLQWTLLQHVVGGFGSRLGRQAPAFALPRCLQRQLDMHIESGMHTSCASNAPAGGHRHLGRRAAAPKRLCQGCAGQRLRSLVTRRICAKG